MAADISETQTYLPQSQAFYGSIKCPIRRLRHESITVDPRQLDLKNVDRLLGVFKLEGCRRLEPQNHIPALISRAALHSLLERIPGGQSSLSPRGEVKTPVQVEPRDDLTCLQGRHRIEAAKRYLHPDDKWWVVDLYADGEALSLLGEKEVNGLREEYSNAKNFYDGDIFRHLRRAHLAGNTFAKARWLSKLSRTKIRDIDLLEKRAAKDPQTRHLQCAFDDLLPFTGLRPALQIGTFHRLLSLRCPEEMTRYLALIKTTWEYILGAEDELRSNLDGATVGFLEGRCPKFSKNDESLLWDKQSDIFPTISVTRVRSLLARVQTIDYTIPSIHTFLEDTKLLEPCAKIMKKLLPSACRTSILQDFGRLHNGQTSWSVQISEASCYLKEEDSSDTAHKNAYRQLWLYTIRHFPEMIGQPLRKDPPRARSLVLGVELVWWYRFTALAEACGYAELDKTYHRGDEADYKMAQTFLQQVRPPQLYGTWTNPESSIQQMVDLLSKDQPILSHNNEGVNLEPVMDVYGVPCGADITSRCGVPFQRAFRKDQTALFLRYIDQHPQSGQREDIGSFTIKQDTFHKFFGSSDRPNEPRSPSLLNLSEPLQHHATYIDEFASTKPADVSSAETGIDNYTQEEIHYTSELPPAQVNHTSPAAQGPVILVPMDLAIAPLPAPVSHPPTDSMVDRQNALRIFEEGNQTRDPNRIIILRQESNGMFRVFTFDRSNKEGISRILPPAGQHEYLVSDEGRDKRIKMTNARSIPSESVVLIGDHGLIVDYEDEYGEL